ncbi:hypothetical protein BGZ65_007310, partial [Modicella reniformis]
YYAAVDTLWREVDLQSVESFILFSRALDPEFSYMDTSSSIRMKLYHHTIGRSVDDTDYPSRRQDYEDEDENMEEDDYDDDDDNKGDHEEDKYETFSGIDDRQREGIFKTANGEEGGRRRRSGRLSLSSTTSSGSEASTASISTTTSASSASSASSSSTSTSSYSLSFLPIP